jgi:hypothetical protein
MSQSAALPSAAASPVNTMAALIDLSHLLDPINAPDGNTATS